MANATILSAWKDTACAYLAVSVAEGPIVNGQQSNIEYIGALPLEKLQGLTNAKIKAALIEAVKAVRQASLAPTPTDLGITGTVLV